MLLKHRVFCIQTVNEGSAIDHNIKRWLKAKRHVDKYKLKTANYWILRAGGTLHNYAYCRWWARWWARWWVCEYRHAQRQVPRRTHDARTTDTRRTMYDNQKCDGGLAISWCKAKTCVLATLASIRMQPRNPVLLPHWLTGLVPTHRHKVILYILTPLHLYTPTPLHTYALHSDIHPSRSKNKAPLSHSLLSVLGFVSI